MHYERQSGLREKAGIYLQDNHSLEANVDLAQYAEEQGIDEIWQAKSRLAPDAISSLSATAAVADDIKLEAGVINNWTQCGAECAVDEHARATRWLGPYHVWHQGLA